MFCVEMSKTSYFQELGDAIQVCTIIQHLVLGAEDIINKRSLSKVDLTVEEDRTYLMLVLYWALGKIKNWIRQELRLFKKLTDCWKRILCQHFTLNFWFKKCGNILFTILFSIDLWIQFCYTGKLGLRCFQPQ